MTTAQNPALQAKIAIWRARAQGQGEPMTLEEYREAIAAIRGDRVGAAMASATSRAKKAKVEVPSADDLLDAI